MHSEHPDRVGPSAYPVSPDDAASLRREVARLRRTCLVGQARLDHLEVENGRLKEVVASLVLGGGPAPSEPGDASAAVVDLRASVAEPALVALQPDGVVAPPARPGRPDGWAVPQLGSRWLVGGAVAGTATGVLAAGVAVAAGVAGGWAVVAVALLGVGVVLAGVVARTAREQSRRLAAALNARTSALEVLRDHDPVTALLNRRSFTRALDRLLALTEFGTSIDVVVLEVDSMAAISHWVGPAGADQLVREVAGRLAGQPGVALVGHLGDGRFAAAGATQLLDASAVSRQLAMTIATSMGPARITTTAGIRRLTAGGPVLGDAALVEAALAVGAARAEGVRAKRFSAALVDDVAWRAEDSIRFATALARGQLSCSWQPIREPESLRAIGFDTIVRWDDPDRGLIPSARWLRAARPEDLARAEAHALSVAARALATALPEGDTWVSVNISAAHLLYFDLGAAVADALDASGLAPHRLVLEVTEREDLVLGDAVGAMNELARLYGVRFAIDDVGAGYSTLRWLIDLPASIVKLDRSVTSLLGVDDAADGLVRAVAQWAEDHGRLLVVEGIESRDQYHRCRPLGIRAVQGWLVGPPAPVLADAATTPAGLPEGSGAAVVRGRAGDHSPG